MEKETADTAGAGNVEAPAPSARERKRETERYTEKTLKPIREPLGTRALKEGVDVAVGE
jgi:hypothetical protein